jgi:acetoin utilization deacetylase AcuC-like enzyme
MRKTGLVYDEKFLLHQVDRFHPELPERIMAAYKGISEGGLLSHVHLIEARRPRHDWIESVHDRFYIGRFEEACLSEKSWFDHSDNQICYDTFEVANLAVGGVLYAVMQVMEGSLDNAFCAIRPPGHHAEADKAMGFCYFNNIAIAAKYIKKMWDIRKIGIIDFDVHHGNGTQHIFEEDPSVFFYSIHEHPSFAYPGTGREFEQGKGNGYGFTLNTPVLPCKGDDEYKMLLERDLFPTFDAFRPEVILVSAGFDAHVDDDMSSIRLSTECFSWIMNRIMEMADIYSKGRIISLLEGGYNIDRLPELIRNHVQILLGI